MATRVLSRAIVVHAAATLTLLTLTMGCGTAGVEGPAKVETPRTFDGLVKLIDAHGGAVVLEGDAGSRVLISPAHQGRIFTMKVGSVESTGLVNAAAIQQGDADPSFNNYGGLDRFWIYPEAGQFGIYFDPGVDLTRELWRVPADFDKGPFSIVSRDKDRLVLKRDMGITNYSGTKFQVRVDREVGIVRADALPAELGVNLPEGVAFAGAYSVNTMTNSGKSAWLDSTGLIGIWILGQFNPSDSAVIIGPFRPGADEELGPPFNDDYFGKVTVETPDRMKVLGNAVLFRADARREGKFGISQRRSTGLAGSIDFGKGLLTIVRFDVPTTPERYANSQWVKVQAEPFKGDVLQSYNSGPKDKTSGELAPVPFYELESTSPVRPLAPGESLRHTHATYHFQGDLKDLAPIAKKLLAVDLDAVRETMLGK